MVDIVLGFCDVPNLHASLKHRTTSSDNESKKESYSADKAYLSTGINVLLVMLLAGADGHGADDLSVIQGGHVSDLPGYAEPHVGIRREGNCLHLTVGSHAIRGGPEVINIRQPSC